MYRLCCCWLLVVSSVATVSLHNQSILSAVNCVVRHSHTQHSQHYAIKQWTMVTQPPDIIWPHRAGRYPSMLLRHNPSFPRLASPTRHRRRKRGGGDSMCPKLPIFFTPLLRSGLKTVLQDFYTQLERRKFLTRFANYVLSPSSVFHCSRLSQYMQKCYTFGIIISSMPMCN